MKKLLTVLCVAAFGIGAVAQAQVEVAHADGIKRMAAQETNVKMTELFESSVFDAAEGRLMASGQRYDTLVWHDQYITDDCDNYYTMVEYMQDVWSADVVFSPFGGTWSGTGEVGTTFQTSDNLYLTYANINLNNSWVVGAVAYVYRRGNAAAWERVGIDRFDADHLDDVNGVTVPALPCRLMGYPGNLIKEQPAFADYYEMLFQNGPEDEITMEMPVTMQGRVPTTEVQYIHYLTPRQDGNRTMPSVHRIAGMFEQVFPAWSNFSLSVQTEQTGLARYDSLWNWAVTAKSNGMCSFVDDWAAWERIDCSNPDSAWVWLVLNGGKELDVSLPWSSEDSIAWGLAPDECPQHDNGKSLYIYAFSMNMGLEDGYHVLPMIYPIVQDRTSIERNQDAYAQTVSVYPLPATDKVNIVALDAIYRVEIYNMAGTLVKVIEMNEANLELDVTSFVPGTYIAKITTENGVVSKKMIIK